MLKYFGSNKFVSKKCKFQQNFCSQFLSIIIFGKKIYGPKRFGSRRIWTQRNFVSQKKSSVMFDLSKLDISRHDLFWLDLSWLVLCWINLSRLDLSQTPVTQLPHTHQTPSRHLPHTFRRLLDTRHVRPFLLVEIRWGDKIHCRRHSSFMSDLHMLLVVDPPWDVGRPS